MSETTPWILLRGLTRDSHHWDVFPAQLQRRFPRAPLVALDLPGNGLLNRLESPATIEAMAAYARAGLVARGLAPPYRLLAVSLGGMVAAAWAAAHAPELEACVLVNSSMRPFHPPHWRLRPAAYGDVLRLLLVTDADGSERTVLRLTSRNARRAGEVLEDWTAWRRAHPVSPKNAVRQLAAAARFRAPLQAPATRLLLLSSRGDALVDPRCSPRLARIWDCPLAEHPHAGHDLTLDDGDWVADQLRRWA